MKKNHTTIVNKFMKSDDKEKILTGSQIFK